MEKPTLTTDGWLVLEAMVTRFEEALHEGRCPRIEDYLVSSEVDRVTLLLELIAAEAEHLWRHGENVIDADYLTLFAQILTSEIDRNRLTDVLNAVRKSVPPPHPAKVGANLGRLAEPLANDRSNHLGRYQMLEQLSATSGGPAESPRQTPVRRADG